MNLIGLAMWIYASHAAPLSGYAVHYDPGRMERVFELRKASGDIPSRVRAGDYDGLAAQTDCSMIGKQIVASLRNPKTGRWTSYRLLVVDCSAPRDRARHLRTGLVVEVDARTAKRAGFFGEGRTKAVVWRSTR